METPCGRLLIPVAERSVWGLLEAVLAGSESACRDTLRQLFRADPALTLWALARGIISRNVLISSLLELARVTAGYLLETLDWEGTCWPEIPANCADREALTSRVMELWQKAWANCGQCGADHAEKSGRNFTPVGQTPAFPESADPFLKKRDTDQGSELGQSSGSERHEQEDHEGLSPNWRSIATWAAHVGTEGCHLSGDMSEKSSSGQRFETGPTVSSPESRYLWRVATCDKDWLTIVAGDGVAWVPRLAALYRSSFPPVGRVSVPAEAAESLSANVDTGPQRGEPLVCAWEAEIKGPEILVQAINPIAEELPRLFSRLKRLAELEAEFTSRLENAKLAALAEFAAGAAHEINNPLAIISGRAQLLLAGEKDPERRRELAQIQTQVQRAHEMIADIRLFARPPLPQMQCVDLARLIREVITELDPEASRREISLKFHDMSVPIELTADPVQLRIAITAICKNAIEAIGEVGQVQLSLRSTEGWVEVVVADNGPGLKFEERSHAFDLFFSGRQAGRGLGFGLPKCWRIVKLHGGEVSVDSIVGQGAVVTLRFPNHRQTVGNQGHVSQTLSDARDGP